jgi:hypothetical protein
VPSRLPKIARTPVIGRQRRYCAIVAFRGELSHLANERRYACDSTLCDMLRTSGVTSRKIVPSPRLAFSKHSQSPGSSWFMATRRTWRLAQCRIFRARDWRCRGKAGVVLAQCRPAEAKAWLNANWLNADPLGSVPVRAGKAWWQSQIRKAWLARLGALGLARLLGTPGPWHSFAAWKPLGSGLACRGPWIAPAAAWNAVRLGCRRCRVGCRLDLDAFGLVGQQLAAAFFERMNAWTRLQVIASPVRSLMKKGQNKSVLPDRPPHRFRQFTDTNRTCIIGKTFSESMT